jgi:WD40 repeat protein
VDGPLMQDITGLLRDVYRALQLYAEPIASHALQVYHSVLATVPHCRLLDYAGRGQTVTPRLVSQRTSDWSSVVKVIAGHTHDVTSVAYSPDGTRIVSGSKDRTVRVWDAHTGKQLAMLEGHTFWVQSVAFSADGAHIVSGSEDMTVRVWDAHTSKQLAVLKGHTGWVWSVAFSPDGLHIVSGSGDKTVRVWDAHSGKQLAVLDGHEYEVVSVAFSPDGKQITSKDKFGAERAWYLSSTLLHAQSQCRTGVYTLSDAHGLTSAVGPIAHLPYNTTEALVWNEKSGWISWQRSDLLSIPLCWLPHERGGGTLASHNKTAVIGARRGAVTILDFSEVIAAIDAAA